MADVFATFYLLFLLKYFFASFYIYFIDAQPFVFAFDLLRRPR